MIDLDAIRARDAEMGDADVRFVRKSLADRRALLAYVDALRAAARKVTQHHFDTCDESKFTGPCSCGVDDLRRLLGES